MPRQPARAASDTLMFEPLARGIHEDSHSLTRAGHRLKQDDVTEAFVPMTVVARVEDGDCAGNYIGAVAHDYRAEGAIFTASAFRPSEEPIRLRD